MFSVMVSTDFIQWLMVLPPCSSSSSGEDEDDVAFHNPPERWWQEISNLVQLFCKTCCCYRASKYYIYWGHGYSRKEEERQQQQLRYPMTGGEKTASSSLLKEIWNWNAQKICQPERARGKGKEQESHRWYCYSSSYLTLAWPSYLYSVVTLNDFVVCTSYFSTLVLKCIFPPPNRFIIKVLKICTPFSLSLPLRAWIYSFHLCEKLPVIFCTQLFSCCCSAGDALS